MSPALESLVARAESLLVRLESLLPPPAAVTDWESSTAFRWRKRGSGGRLEPVRHVASIRLHSLVEVEPQKQRLLRNTADDYAPKPDYRPLTKFENRGLKLGHGVWDLVFRRA